MAPLTFEAFRAAFVAAALLQTPDAAEVDALAGAPPGWRTDVAYDAIAREAWARDDWQGWDAIARASLAFTVVLFETGGRARFQIAHEGAPWNDAGRSRCMMQIHQGAALVPFAAYRVTLDEWATLTGPEPDAARRCAAAGVRILAYHARRCRVVKPAEQGALTVLGAYRSGGACAGDDRDRQRARFFARFAASVRRNVDAGTRPG